MTIPNPATRSRENLTAELMNNRRESMKATERGDFRMVARLTLEAAQLNKAIAATFPPENPSF